jgi:hypothetical protein
MLYVGCTLVLIHKLTADEWYSASTKLYWASTVASGASWHVGGLNPILGNFSDVFLFTTYLLKPESLPVLSSFVGQSVLSNPF